MYRFSYSRTYGDRTLFDRTTEIRELIKRVDTEIRVGRICTYTHARENLATTMKIPDRPVDKVRVLCARKKEEKGASKKRRRDGETGVTGTVAGKVGQDQRDSDEQESVGGIPLAPRDDNHLVSQILGVEAYDQACTSALARSLPFRSLPLLRNHPGDTIAYLSLFRYTSRSHGRG